MFHDWYLYAAAALTFAVQVVRKAPGLRERLWSRVPEGYRWAVVVGLGVAIAIAEALLDGTTPREALLAAVGGALGIGPLAMGLAAALRDSPLPWDGRGGGKPSPPAALEEVPPVTRELGDEPERKA